MVDQTFLNNYYATKWNRDPCNTPMKSGLQLLSKIADTEYVIDVGCGRNPFKGKINNLIGIDPAFAEADVQTTILEYNPNRLFDVALCLGSINFGSKDYVEQQIAKVISWLKPSARIYWRSNPNSADHDDPECHKIPFYNWSIEEHHRLSKVFNFELVECVWDIGGSHRIYAEWKR